MNQTWHDPLSFSFEVITLVENGDRYIFSRSSFTSFFITLATSSVEASHIWSSRPVVALFLSAVVSSLFNAPYLKHFSCEVWSNTFHEVLP